MPFPTDDLSLKAGGHCSLGVFPKGKRMLSPNFSRYIRRQVGGLEILFAIVTDTVWRRFSRHADAPPHLRDTSLYQTF